MPMQRFLSGPQRIIYVSGGLLILLLLLGDRVLADLHQSTYHLNLAN